jgi:hypothetical protein
VIPPGDRDITFPSEGDPDTKDYSLRVLIADGKGGWTWRNIAIRLPHVFKAQFSELREVPGFFHSHALDASKPPEKK